MRQSLETSARTRQAWLDVETPGGTAGNVVTTPEWREVYRRFDGDLFFKAEGDLLAEFHARNAARGTAILRGEFQAGVHAWGIYWLAEWKPRYTGRDGFADTLARQNQFAFRARTNVLPEPPEGTAFDIQPNFAFGYVDAWPETLDRWTGEAEAEFVARLDPAVLLTVAPKLEWSYYRDVFGMTREDIIESLRVSTKFRVAPGWAFTIEAQVSQTESTAPGADNFTVSVTPVIRNIIRF